MDFKVTDLKGYDRILSKNLSEKYLNDSLSKHAKNQLADIDDQDDKMLNLLLKKISKFKKENKTLREQNKKLQIELKSLQILLKKSQKDVERSRENYKVLESVNKSLTDTLKNKLTSHKLNEAGHSEETRKHISLVEKTILINSNYINNGLLSLNSYNLQLIFS